MFVLVLDTRRRIHYLVEGRTEHTLFAQNEMKSLETIINEMFYTIINVSHTYMYTCEMECIKNVMNVNIYICIDQLLCVLCLRLLDKKRRED